MKDPVKIAEWIKNYSESAGLSSFVVGISGGIDSALVSTLCAMSGVKTFAVGLPLHQRKELNDLSQLQGRWLTKKFDNVNHVVIDLSSSYDEFKKNFPNGTPLSFANTKSRLRMTALYQIAGSNLGLVVGTGNKVEDFGVGFYTKYGDGGVDISPIADMMKTEVWEMAKNLKIPKEIIDAPPTDGLWEDGRTDQDQLGLTYQELENAMRLEEHNINPVNDDEKRSLQIYRHHRRKNLHKMLPIPVYR